MDSIDKKIINHLQGGFPLCENPYEVVAAELGISGSELLTRIEALINKKTISRFAPLYHAELLGGGLTLAALEVPADRFDDVNEIVNSFPEVAHNYAREHKLNMWFVVATEQAERIGEVLADIEQQTGLHVYNMPKQEEFFIGLKLEV